MSAPATTPGAVTRAVVTMIAGFMLALRQALVECEHWRWAVINLMGRRRLFGQVRGVEAVVVHVRALRNDGSFVEAVYMRAALFGVEFRTELEVRVAAVMAWSRSDSVQGCSWEPSPILDRFCAVCAQPAFMHSDGKHGIRAAPGVLASERAGAASSTEPATSAEASCTAEPATSDPDAHPSSQRMYADEPLGAEYVRTAPVTSDAEALRVARDAKEEERAAAIAKFIRMRPARVARG